MSKEEGAMAYVLRWFIAYRSRSYSSSHWSKEIFALDYPACTRGDRDEIHLECKPLLSFAAHSCVRNSRRFQLDAEIKIKHLERAR